MNAHSQRSNGYLWLLVILAIAAYTLPWVTNPGVSLSLGAYDLAEWASLHPQVRMSPLLITSLFLRLQPVLLALLIAFKAPHPIWKKGWWLSFLFVIVTAAALLPPLEFFSNARGDGNYQQQFGIVLITLTGGTIGLSGMFSRWNSLVTIVIALGSMITSSVGLLQAYTLMQEFKLPTEIGLGWVLLIAVYAIIMAAYIRSRTIKEQGSAQ